MTTDAHLREIKAGHGVAIELKRGAVLRIVNTPGTQVVDTWAVMAGDPTERMSMEHTRRTTGRIHPSQGDVLCSNRRTPMLEIIEDDTRSTHDTLVACCDRWLYAHYGCPPGHRSCHDNFLEALEELGIDRDSHPDLIVPNPLNLWMNVPVGPNAISIHAPVSKPDDSITLKALRDVIVVASACPMDVSPSAGAAPVNGEDLTPCDVHYEIMESA